MTDKMMSDQVYIFRYHVQIQRPDGLAVKAFGSESMTPETWVQYLEKSIFLKFSNFDSYDIFTCLGAYIPSFGLK